MKYSVRRFIILCAVLLALAIPFTASASDTLTFSGRLTVTYGGNQTKINGSGNIPLPETLRAETQDDHPQVMASIFAEEGYTRRKAAITVRASKPFKVSGERVNGVYAIRGKGDNARLESIGGNESPYTIPAKKGDYYIGIDYEPEDDEELDYAILLYVKVAVK